MQPYLKFKEHYDREAKASLLKIGDHPFIIQHLAGHQGLPFC